MFKTEQVEHGFHRREGGEGHFGEDGNPVCHGAVPQSRQLLHADVLSFVRLVGDESLGGVDEFLEVEFLALVVLYAADEVYRIEVGGGIEDVLLFRLLEVDLRRFGNHEAGAAVLAFHPEGTAARFAFVLDHAADADGAVEQVPQVFDVVFPVFETFACRFFVADGAQESVHFLQLLVGGFLVEEREVAEYLLLQFHE